MCLKICVVSNINTNEQCSGYMSPEYAMKGVFSMKSDVYSFGVLLLEIVSGEKNSSYEHPELSLSLLPYVRTNKICPSISRLSSFDFLLSQRKTLLTSILKNE